MSASEVPYGARRRKPKSVPLTAEESDIFGPEPVAPRIDPTDGSHVDCDCVVCEKDAADADRVLARIVAESPSPASAGGHLPLDVMVGAPPANFAPGKYDGYEIVDAPVPVSAVGQIAEQVRRVHELRFIKAHLGDALTEDRRAFDVEHADEIRAFKEQGQEVEAAEAALRALALAHYHATGETKPTAGVEVKTKNTYTVTDLVAALAWAKKSEMCLIPESVDTKALLKIATVTPLPFVAHTTMPAAQIATDLARVLA